MPTSTSTAVRRPRALAALAAAACLALGATSCGDDGGSDASGGSASTTATTAAPEPISAAGPGEVADTAPVPSAGCGTTTVRSVLGEERFVDDSDRWFLLTTPLDHDGRTPLPLVLDFHGLAEGAVVHSRMSDLGAFAEENGFVVAFPHGTGSPVRWSTEADRTGNPDLVFVEELLDQLQAELCLDTSRVYATGLSNGAFMSSTLACTMDDRFTAVAPVAGVLRPDDCAADRPVPMLGFHGTDDAILLFNGGVGAQLNRVLAGESADDAEPLPPAELDGEGFPANVAAWAADNGCEPEPVDTDLSDTALLRTYGCPAEGAVEFVVLEGGGHTWPGSELSVSLEGVMGATDLTVDANELIWAFFQRFSLPSA